eukprot:1097066-Amorphochlora_amoeboformis.AAC.1
MAAMSGAFLSQNWEAVDIPPANFATLSDGSISDDELKAFFPNPNPNPNPTPNITSKTPSR